MPRTYRNQVFVSGVLQSEDVVSLSDALFATDDARARLRAIKIAATLDAWAADARTASAAEQAASDGWSGFTAAQKDTANKALHTRMAVTFDRLATFFDRFGDVLVGLDQ
jgi:hypothetical protein